MPSRSSTARKRWLRNWARRYWTWLRRRKAVGSLVTAFVVAVLGTVGAMFGAAVIDWLTDDYRITVEDNPDQLSTATGPRGGAYIVPVSIEDVGDPPNQNNSCVGRYEWARDLDGIDADTTFLRLTVAAVGDHDVRITGFAPRIVERSSPAIGTHLSYPGRGEQPEVRSVGVDLDADPPGVSVTDENGVPIETTFDVRGEQRETFEVTVNTMTCDCSWELDVHLVVDGEDRVETVRRSDGEPFRTSGSGNARSYRFVDGAWRAEEETGEDGLDGSEPAPPAPVDACELLDTPTIASLLQQGVTPQPLGPVTSPGLSENLLTETRCSWAGSASPGRNSEADSGVLDSVEVSVDQFNDEDRAAEELQARRPMYPGLEDATFDGADEGYAGAGVAVARVGSLLVTVNVVYEPSAAARLAERFMTDALARL